MSLPQPAEDIWQPIYDRVHVFPEHDELRFFVDPMGAQATLMRHGKPEPLTKTRQHTNLMQSGVLAPGRAFQVHAIGHKLHPSGDAAIERAWRRIADDGYFELRIIDRAYTTLSLSALPLLRGFEYLPALQDTEPVRIEETEETRDGDTLRRRVVTRTGKARRPGFGLEVPVTIDSYQSIQPLMRFVLEPGLAVTTLPPFDVELLLLGYLRRPSV